MGLVEGIKNHLEKEAEKLTTKWLDEYRSQIKGLSDERQDVYREIREMSADPLNVDLAQPKMWLQMTSARGKDGKEELLPLFKKHLLSDEEGNFPVEHNSWEEKVLAAELAREDNVAWYRNPARASQDSLGVTYQEAGETKILRPDFIFFSRLADGAIVADIIDPHGTQFGDALPKAKGLAEFIETQPNVFRRVEVCAEVDGTFKCIDLAAEEARKLVQSAGHIQEIYRSDLAKLYTD